MLAGHSGKWTHLKIRLLEDIRVFHQVIILLMLTQVHWSMILEQWHGVLAQLQSQAPLVSHPDQVRAFRQTNLLNQLRPDYDKSL